MMSENRTSIPNLALAGAGLVTVLFGVAMYLPLGPSDFGIWGEILLGIFVMVGSVLATLGWYNWKTGRSDVSIAVFAAWVVVALLDPVGLFGVVENTQLAAGIGAAIAGTAAISSWFLYRQLIENSSGPSAAGCGPIER